MEFPIRIAMAEGFDLLVHENGGIDIKNDELGEHHTILGSSFYYLDLAAIRQALTFSQKAREIKLEKLQWEKIADDRGKK